ncbi:MAG: FprA family A-type flavoprotein [Candidatus Heimdallarchaeota archaeon]
MKPREIKSRISWVGAIDRARRLVDSLTPIPEGTSYNAYLIQGDEKTVLLDTVDRRKEKELLKRLEQVPSIDYVVVQHAELCHAGSIPAIFEQYPEAKVLSTQRAKKILMDHLGLVEERIQTVHDGEILSLGPISLKFIHTRFVHWPETMVTYIPEEKVLFTCDLFAAHIATDDLYAGDDLRIIAAAKRFYAEMLAHYREPMVQRVLEKLRFIDVTLIAPGHGPVYDIPILIQKAYDEWVFSKPKNLVFLPYLSMYGSTKAMVDYIAKMLTQKGVGVNMVDLEEMNDLGKLATALVDPATIILATPTTMGGPHPYHVNLLYLMSILKPKAKFLSLIGSYGWARIINKSFGEMTANLNMEILDPVLSKGPPQKQDFQMLKELAATITKKHEEEGLLF